MKQPIRVLELCASLSVGGAERLVLHLGKHLDRKRFNVHTVGLSVIKGNALQSEFEQAGVPVHVIGTRRFHDPRGIIGVARYVRQHNIDVIHTHLTQADVVGRIVGKLTGRPVVSTMHNVPHDYDQQRFDRSVPQRFTAKYLATCLVGVSPRISAMYIDQWRVPPDRIKTIRNAVPMEPFLAVAPGTQHAPGEGPLITNVGRLNTQKAQHILLDAAKIVLAQRPDARFMLVGQGRLEDKLKAQAQALGIAERVVFAGVRHDIPQVLAESDVFVLSSLWEGLPVSGIEAMAAARPVVLTDVGGNRDLVDDGTHGLIVPPRDVQALADALLTLINNDALRVQMGQAARKRVQADFSLDSFVRLHEELYLSVFNRWRKTAGKRSANAAGARTYK